MQFTGKLTDIKKGFQAALNEAKIKNLRFRDLSHTFATRMADLGTDAYTLVEIMGHADIKTSMIYVHASAEAGRRAVEKLHAKRHFGYVLVTETKKAGVTPVVSC